MTEATAEIEDGDEYWGSVHHASLIRLVVLMIWCLILAFTPYTSYADLPTTDIVFFGIGRAVLSSEQMAHLLFTPSSLRILQLVGLFLCASCMLWTSRPLSVAALIAVLVLDSTTKAVGDFANHGQIAPLLSLALLTVAWCPRYMSLGSALRLFRGGQEGHLRDRSCRPVVWLVAFVLVVPYCFIGINRVMTGGIGIFSGDALYYYFGAASRSFEAYPEWLRVVVAAASHPPVFALVTAAEISAPLALLSMRYRPIWLFGSVVFHLSTMVLMNILFWENLLLLVVVFGVRVSWVHARRCNTP